MSTNTPTKLIVHHAGGTDANPLQDSSNYTVAMCDADHKIRFGMQSRTGHWAGYHYIITKDGALTQTRFDDEEGAHTIGQNTSSLGIMLCGNFDATLPTDAQVKTLTQWLKDKTKQYNISKENIFPHRHFANKTCYGNRITDDWAAKLLITTPDNTKIISLLEQVIEELKGRSN